ncbi:MAG: response regulator [Burkholderiaceae bacterium]
MARVLAVDDSPSIRQIVSFTLRGAGHDVVEAVDGQDALEKSEGQSFDLVLTDQNMPRCDGLTLVRTLRQKDAFNATPILMLTTESSSEMKDAGRQAGATGWLVKPFDPVKLLELIDYVTQPR